MNNTIDDLLQKPYWIIDIFPKQVPENSPGQFFSVEKYYLDKDHIAAIKQKHIDVILKLNCYRDLSIDEGKTINPPPEEVAKAMRTEYLSIFVDDALIISEPDDTHMTVFNPDNDLLELIRALSTGEGLYFWGPCSV